MFLAVQIGCGFIFLLFHLKESGGPIDGAGKWSDLKAHTHIKINTKIQAAAAVVVGVAYTSCLAGGDSSINVD